MIVVIFGAGASFDSIPSRPAPAFHPSRPPLANDLFGDRQLFNETIRDFAKMQRIVPRLRHSVGQNVESVLRELQLEGERLPERHQQLMAVRYYLHVMLWRLESEWKTLAWGVTNYKSFLDEIAYCKKENEPVCLATFNYDTLLDEALTDFDIKIENIDDYVSRSPVYRLFKLHGSINWARIVQTAIYRSDQDYNDWEIGRRHIELANTLPITEEFVLVQSYPVGLLRSRGTPLPLVPAIAIPVEQKAYFECPKKHLYELEKLLPETDKLILIGWRATEDHFLEVLRNRLPKHVSLLVVAANEGDAQQIGQRFDAALPGTVFRPEFATGGFTDLVINRRARAFLMK